MHRALFIQEIVLNIFSYYPSFESRDDSNANLAALARTCRAFKEPALDLLWEELDGIAPLARCLPQACYTPDNKRYSFSRELYESERNILRGYARRVRYIGFSFPEGPLLDPGTTKVILTLVPFAEPLFPNLQSLFWEDPIIPPIMHAAVPSLTSLHLKGNCPTMEFMQVLGGYCQNMKNVNIDYASPNSSFDAAVSRQVCRWAHLRSLTCASVTLSADAILHLATFKSALDELSFTLSIDVLNHLSNVDSNLVFGCLASLHIEAVSLLSITQFLLRVCLPGITSLTAVFVNDAWKPNVRAYWTAVEQACSSDTLRSLMLKCDGDEIQNPELQMTLQLTLDDLAFYKTLRNLDKINIELPWVVKLTDNDLLALVGNSPNLTSLTINAEWGWEPDDGEGITLDGLVQLLKRCPSLELIQLVFNTKTFTGISQEQAMSLQPEPMINVLDSHISPDSVPGLASVFTALNVELFLVCDTRENVLNAGDLWERVKEIMSES